MVDIDTSAYVPEKPGGPVRRLLSAVGRAAYALQAGTPGVMLAEARNEAYDGQPLDPSPLPHHKVFTGETGWGAPADTSVRNNNPQN